MKDFAVNVLTQRVPEGGVGFFFLGQAGFLFKTPKGELIAVDPYLSNCCERYFGFKRLMPHILDPRDLVLDALIVSHAHYDHFDPDSVPILLENGKTIFVGACDTRAECERLGLVGNLTFLSRGESFTHQAFRLTATACDHGALAPDALGLLLEIEGKRIYIMGDTAYRPELWDAEAFRGVDLLILPINGAFGNLNEEEAAKVVSALRPRLAVPCHYWNFAEHGGNPGLFAQKMAELAPDASYRLMRQGEGGILP